MASCIGEIARNIVPNCANPIVAGYTGRGILIPYGKQGVIVQNAENPRIIESLGEPTLVIEIDNSGISQAFNGTLKASVADTGKKQISKTMVVRIPLRGAGNSKDIIEPLLKSPLGFIAVLEKKDKVGDGSFEIVGFQMGLRTNDDGVAQNEYENGADVVVTMSCIEDWYEVTLFAESYANTLEMFEALLAQAV